MYNKLLDTFKAVADYGSFSKAANELFITHTALIKQINSLEEYLGVKLFSRTHHGTSLTPAGQVLYSETLELIKTSDKIISQVQEAHFAYPKIFLIGTSTLYPCQVFMELWDQIVKEHPDYQLKIVSFNNDAHRLTLLNDAFDFVVGPYNNPSESKDFVFIPLGSYRFTLSFNRNHHLAHKKSISFQDLSQENIMIMKPGISPINDEIRNKIISKYPHINIIDINPYYDI
ncbi:MAG: LysR family transcriptional regulator, partial [Thomasclavelia ramosa]|nr:LysR family transcriptional regulator [Thomasclavelia ramosa]